MKAVINGVAVEGSPQEITEYQIIVDQKRREGVYIKPPLGQPPEWLRKEIEEAQKRPNMDAVKGYQPPEGCVLLVNGMLF